VNETRTDTTVCELPDVRTPEGAPLSVRPRRIGIWGHYGGCNQGDDLVVTTLIANIRARIPDAQIVGFCLNPADTRQRHGIPAFAIYRFAERHDKRPHFWTPEQRVERSPIPRRFERTRAFIKRHSLLMAPLRGIRGACRAALAGSCKAWGAFTFPFKEVPFLRRCYRSLRGTDLLIVAGSGPLFDGWSGAWAHPYALFVWGNLARLCGSRMVCLSAGAGPLTGRLSRFFLRHAMQATSYRSYRDPSSAKLIAGLGVKGEHPVFPDMGFGLDVTRYVRPWERPGAARNRTIVGLGVMAHCDPRYIPRSDLPRYAAYVRKMAGFAAWLLHNDYAVLIASSDIGADPRTFADVRELLRREHGIHEHPRLIEPVVEDLSALASLFSACDCVVAARYHCIVLPWLLGKPVVALAYNRKQIDLMQSMGLGQYCLDIDHFEVPELVERFRAMEYNRDAIRAQLLEGVARCRARLAEQYDRVLGPLGAAGRTPGPAQRVAQPLPARHYGAI
jgi:polysaccharide pyruvyl transferase WcaK-like protein